MSAQRLHCDEMLKGIGRWLRAAGHDVAIAADGAHDERLAHARAESRLLLTCDRRLAERSSDDAVIAVLATERPDAAAGELGDRLGIDCLHAPFSRCLLDNALLEPSGEEDVANLPAAVRQGDGPIMRCPRCGRVYWPGSHVRRMRAKLARWHDSRGRSSPGSALNCSNRQLDSGPVRRRCGHCQGRCRNLGCHHHGLDPPSGQRPGSRATPGRSPLPMLEMIRL